MKTSTVIFAFLFSLLIGCQSHSEKGANCKGNTIIQYFGSDIIPTQHFTQGPRPENRRSTLTRPGKMGPMGPVGPKGDKGAIGMRGPKGDDCNVTELQVLKEELKELRLLCGKHQVKTRNHSCDTIKGPSGMYTIQPDLRFLPFSVYCNFSDPSQPKTLVGHNVETERAVEDCEPNLCFKVNVNYTASLQQIAGLISISSRCQQYIKIRCQGAWLHYPQNTVTAWISRTGETKLNWGGSERDGYCACGETNTCIDNEYKCNCDQNSNDVMTADEGYLTAKDDLPVTALHIGDTGADSEHAWYTLGKLECW